uniref:Uncharacterized protein n=1 Tax=Anguilla anguilla TaxID=7936 RepID=A0A0E9XAK7_ANGAN
MENDNLILYLRLKEKLLFLKNCVILIACVLVGLGVGETRKCINAKPFLKGP